MAKFHLLSLPNICNILSSFWSNNKDSGKIDCLRDVKGRAKMYWATVTHKHCFFCNWQKHCNTVRKSLRFWRRGWWEKLDNAWLGWIVWKVIATMDGIATFEEDCWLTFIGVSPSKSLDDISITSSRDSLDGDSTRIGYNNGYLTLDVRETWVNVSIEAAKSPEEIP